MEKVFGYSGASPIEFRPSGEPNIDVADRSLDRWEYSGSDPVYSWLEVNRNLINAQDEYDEHFNVTTGISAAVWTQEMDDTNYIYNYYNVIDESWSTIVITVDLSIVPQPCAGSNDEVPYQGTLGSDCNFVDANWWK